MKSADMSKKSYLISYKYFHKHITNMLLSVSWLVTLIMVTPIISYLATLLIISGSKIGTAVFLFLLFHWYGAVFNMVVTNILKLFSLMENFPAGLGFFRVMVHLLISKDAAFIDFNLKRLDIASYKNIYSYELTALVLLPSIYIYTNTTDKLFFDYTEMDDVRCRLKIICGKERKPVVKIEEYLEDYNRSLNSEIFIDPYLIIDIITSDYLDKQFLESMTKDENPSLKKINRRLAPELTRQMEKNVISV